MEYIELKNYLESGLSLRKICEKSSTCLGSVRYWVKKYKLKPNFKNFKNGYSHTNKKIIGNTRYCPICKIYKNFEEFYKKRNKNCSGYCKKCTTKQTVSRGKKLKSKCVEYKGGKCQLCGYKKCFAALEFHHRNFEEKDFSISSKYKNKNINLVIKKELDKCDVLCVNCHRETHFKKEIINESIISGRRLKAECVMYKGGECEKCGYKKCFGALEFHHRNPKEKEFSICKKYSSRKLTDKIKKELDKCEILCGNCHREEHQKIREVGLEPTTPAL